MLSLMCGLFRRRGTPGLGRGDILLSLGLLVVGIGLALFVSTSRTSTQLTAEELQRYWRTSYDLLVRPPGAVTDTEQKHRLVRANYLSGLYGGISIEQYHAIRDMPEVEIAAPIAMIGYMNTRPSSFAGELEEEGTYRYTRIITVTDNIREYTSRRQWYAWVGPPPDEKGRTEYVGVETYEEITDNERRERLRRLEEAGLVISPSNVAVYDWGDQWLFSLAGIDPEQEARLIDFSDAITAGRFLNPEDEVEMEDQVIAYRSPSGEIEEVRPGFYSVPLLINSHIYAQAQARFVVDLLDAPKWYEVITNTLQQGRKYLEALPVVNHVYSREIALEEVYQWVFEALQKRGLGDVQVSGCPDFKQPSPVEYVQTHLSWLDDSEGVLEAIPMGTGPDGQVLFRTTKVLPYRYAHNYNVVGAFDIAKLRDPYSKDLNVVSMEAYHPPVVTLRYDEEGHPVEPVQMIPTLNPEGYILVPPYGARVFAGDDCISAIRVRVSGVETLNEESWARILAVAQEIRDLTGLQVDTTLGSSPTPLLVHLPGIGYVEEPWVKTGVSISIHRGFNRADLVFLGVMFGVCGIYVFSMSSVNALGRRREIGLLAALGWRQGIIFGLLLGKALLLALVAGLLGVLLSLAAITLFHLGVPPAQAALALPLGLALYLLGSFYPAWRAARQAPVTAIQMGELRLKKVRLGQLTLLSYGLRNALQRLNRTALSVLGMMVSTGLVVLFLLISLEMGGSLEGTLLGTHVAVQIRPYHYVMGGVCFIVSGLTLADVILLNVMERRREIGVLKAVGWHSGDVLRGFLLEGGLMGLVGGALGCFVAGIAFWGFYRVVPEALGWMAPLGVGLTVGMSALASWIAVREAVMSTLGGVSML